MASSSAGATGLGDHQTMRRAGCAAASRASAVVLQRADTAKRERALAIRAALCGMRDAARPAATPVPKRVLHPMQDMELLCAA